MRSNGRPGQVTHGASSVLRRLRDGDLDARLGPGRQIRELVLRLARDLGASSPKELPVQKQILVRRLAVKEVTLRMMEAFALAGDVIGKDGRLLSPLGDHYLAFANSVRLDLVALGLERRAKDALDLNAYVEQRYGTKERVE